MNTCERLLALDGVDALVGAFRARLRGQWGPRPGDDDRTWADAVFDAVRLGGDREDVQAAVLRLFDEVRRTPSTQVEAAAAFRALSVIPWRSDLRSSLVDDLSSLVRRITCEPERWGGLDAHDVGVDAAAVEAARSLFALGGRQHSGAVPDLFRVLIAGLNAPPLSAATALGTLAAICALVDPEQGRRVMGALDRLDATPVPGTRTSPRSAAYYAMNVFGSIESRRIGVAWRNVTTYEPAPAPATAPSTPPDDGVRVDGWERRNSEHALYYADGELAGLVWGDTVWMAWSITCPKDEDKGTADDLESAKRAVEAQIREWHPHAFDDWKTSEDK